ncbi:hypothetical protein [Nioella aestuarii]|uniref:hypothetical protein n=1 Tax=Nioella aestuarii TaxID=1662864 RepID=UPI003D7F3251
MAPTTTEASQGSPELSVRRFTTKFVPDEDRIQVLIELSSGEVKVAWLTRRLLNRLAKALLERLESSQAIVSVDAPRAAVAAQRFSQADAVSRIKPQTAVTLSTEVEDAHTQALVTRVDVHTRTKGILLVMYSDEGLVQALPLTEQDLRQWLGVIHDQYKAGGWQERFWPSWMRQTDQASGVSLRANRVRLS